MITLSELIALLKEQAWPNQGKWAKAHDVWPSELSDVLKGRRDPNRRMLDALGYERVVLYRKIEGKQ